MRKNVKKTLNMNEGDLYISKRIYIFLGLLSGMIQINRRKSIRVYPRSVWHEHPEDENSRSREMFLWRMRFTGERHMVMLMLVADAGYFSEVSFYKALDLHIQSCFSFPGLQRACLTEEFSVHASWGTQRVRMSLLQLLVLECFKIILIPDGYTLKCPNKTVKLLNHETENC